MKQEIVEARIRSVDESIIDIKHEIGRSEARIKEISDSDTGSDNQESINLIKDMIVDLNLRVSNLENVKRDLTSYYNVALTFDISQ